MSNYIYNKGIALQFIAVLMMAVAFIVAPAGAQEVSDLKGYSTLNVSPHFEKFLDENPNIKRRLQQNEDLSEALLNDKSLQAQLLSGKTTLFELQRDLMKETAEDKKAKNKQEATSGDKNQIQLNQRSSARAQNNINNALNVLAGQKRAAAKAQQAAEVAEKRQEALENLIKDLAENNPQALALFMQDGKLQQDIIDGAITIEDAMASLDVKLTEQETEAFETTVEAVVEEVEETEEVASVDMNRVPTPAEAELDANGWPKYLNVPESCPGPDENMAYIYEAYALDQAHGRPAGEQDDGPLGMSRFFENIRSSQFSRSGVTFSPFITDKEIIAAPFYVDNAEGLKGQIGTISPPPSIGSRTNQEFSFSYCPGDFNNVHTPEGRPELLQGGGKKGDRYSSHKYYKTLFADNPIRDALYKSNTHYILEPGERYFFNIRINQRQAEAPEVGACMEAYGPGSYHDQRSEESDLFTSYEDVKKRKVKGEELPLCGWLFVHYGHMHDGGTRPPYTGPMLGLDGPYPINYSGKLYPKHIQEQRKQAIGCKGRDFREVTYSCHDPEDELPPQRFTRKCVNGVYEWVEGRDASAYPQYRCELTRNGKTEHIDGHGAARHHHIPCGAHRNGQIRKITSIERGNMLYSRTEQCQFDNERGRYDWVMVNTSMPGEFNYQGAPNRYSYNNTSAPAHRDQCKFAGKSYNIGTSIRVSCDAHSFGRQDEIFTCEQRADEPSLPRLVRQEGYIGKHQSYPPNCSVEEI